MHTNNKHRSGYDFEQLSDSFPQLADQIIVKENQEKSIDFSNPKSLKLLNAALLKMHYGVNYVLDLDNSLIAPVPGRVDYLHYLKELTNKKDSHVLDIGTGASLIYPLLGASEYGWSFKAVDIEKASIDNAQKQMEVNPHLKNLIEIKYQEDRGAIFRYVILPKEHYDFTMCNPPFYTSEEEAQKANFKKNVKLGLPKHSRNFLGNPNELWCNGGEALFIKRMIKESVQFKTQVSWFTTLVSQSEHLPKIYKQLDKLKASHKTIEMLQGKKKSRIVAWQFAH